MFWGFLVNLGKELRNILVGLGFAFIIWGLFIVVNYAFRMNSDLSWGERYLLYDLGFIVMGISFELLGSVLVLLGRK